ncbi:unnamed protein product [Meloidogyne enterolobii]|uniref:Uncharacterized protein n=1 Tax=Meloidogyne enterolobii TaxID=390850 RepID=A0ACB0XQ42_MELEN
MPKKGQHLISSKYEQKKKQARRASESSESSEAESYATAESQSPGPSTPQVSSIWGDHSKTSKIQTVALASLKTGFQHILFQNPEK